jgi:peroxidase
VQLGRRDSLTASKAAADNSLPPPTSNISTLISKFQDVGLTEKDLVTLSGCPNYIYPFIFIRFI